MIGVIIVLLMVRLIFTIYLRAKENRKYDTQSDEAACFCYFNPLIVTGSVMGTPMG